MENHGELDERKKAFLMKPLYQLAQELQNETCAPSLNSYGGSDVYLRYKKNKWFENVDIIALKRLREDHEQKMLLEVLDVGQRLEHERKQEEARAEKEKQWREKRLKELTDAKKAASLPRLAK